MGLAPVLPTLSHQIFKVNFAGLAGSSAVASVAAVYVTLYAYLLAPDLLPAAASAAL